MRWLRIALALGVLAGGLVFGALNDGDLEVNLHFARFTLSAGAALLAAALLGALGAGLCLWLALIWPLKRRLREAQRLRPSSPTGALEPLGQDRA